MVSGTAVDLAGNSTSLDVTVNIDLTPPAIAPVPVPAPNGNGWNNTAVTVSFNASDNLSGIESLTDPVALPNEGEGQVVSGTAVDLAGNSASASVTVNIDLTPPLVAITFPSDGDTINDTSVQLQASISGSISGLAAIQVANSGVPVFETLPGGQQSVQIDQAVDLQLGDNLLEVTAIDVADNLSTSSITVTQAPGCVPENLVASFVDDSTLVILNSGNSFTAELEPGATISTNTNSRGGIFGTNVEFSCGTCAEATFADADNVLRGSGICGNLTNSGSVGDENRLIVENDDPLCARSTLTGNTFDIDLASRFTQRRGCLDADGGESCTNAGGNTSYIAGSAGISLSWEVDAITGPSCACTGLTLLRNGSAIATLLANETSFTDGDVQVDCVERSYVLQADGCTVPGGLSNSASFTPSEFVPPEISGVVPADGTTTPEAAIELRASISDQGGGNQGLASVQVSLNGTSVLEQTLAGDSFFQISPSGAPLVRPLQVGDNVLSIQAADLCGNSTTALSTFERLLLDDIPPVIQISSPVDGSFTLDPSVTLVGTISDPNLALGTALINGAIPVFLSATGDPDTFSFSEIVELFFDENPFMVSASDVFGNSASQTVTVNFGLPPTGGTIEGLIFDATDNLPIPGMQVRVDGTDILTTTNEGGFYSLQNIPVGPQILVYGEVPESLIQSTRRFAYAMGLRKPTPDVVPGETITFRPIFVPRDELDEFKKTFGPLDPCNPAINTCDGDDLDGDGFPDGVVIGGETFFQLLTEDFVVLESPTVPGVSVTIPPGLHVNIRDPRFVAGAPMTVDTLPTPLPDGVFAAGVFGFGPEGAFFTFPGLLPDEPCTAATTDPLCFRVPMRPSSSRLAES